MDETLTFDAWLRDVRDPAMADPIWRLPVYRQAAYSTEIGWPDVRRLARSTVTSPVAGQLLRALGSIGANLAEGYSRSSGRDRVRLYEYSLGSARECVVWYRAARQVLGAPTIDHRQETLQQIIRMLLITIPRERGRNMEKRS
jgi:four helix bundle protein